MMKLLIALLIIACSMFMTGRSEEGDVYTATGNTARVFGEGPIEVYYEPSDADEPFFTLDNKTEVTIIKENTISGYTLINYHGQSGYVKSENLDMMAGVGGLSVYSSLSDDTKLQLNKFITRFTEADLTYFGQGVFDVNDTTDEIMNRCAIDLGMFEDTLETEFGDFEYGNTKIYETDEIAQFVKDNFGVEVKTNEAAYLTYHDGAYYYDETGGTMKGDFAIVTNVIDMQDGTYEIRFSGFGLGYNWDETSLAMSEEEARAAFNDFPGTAGYALISAEDINDISTYRLIKLVTAR